MDWKRIKNDINGNGRWVCHWTTLETKPNYKLTLTERYAKAVELAHEIGGRKYHTKDYPGGIVFQTHGPEQMAPIINELLEKQS